MFLYEDSENGDYFRIKTTSSYVYYARSWSSSTRWEYFYLDSKRLDSDDNLWGDISATDFAPDVFHSVTVMTDYTNGKGVLALLYRDTP